MAKRDRDDNRQILIQGFGCNVKADDIINVFHKFGRIEFVRFIGRRQCIVKFETPESAAGSLHLNNTKQSSLSSPSLLVSQLEYSAKPIKKSHFSSGSYIVLDPPRFNNYLIPVLPSFLTNFNT